MNVSSSYTISKYMWCTYIKGRQKSLAEAESGSPPT
jgi:hypothetical protein